MGILATLIIGAIAGFVAGKLMRGQGYGVIGNIIVGIIGSILGGWLSSLLIGVDLTNGFNLTTLIVSIIGAVIAIFVWGLITRRRTTRA
jgi:uncharacterized membrane protein YeaQ/YmgE (transglycosylase-associated protein family)